MTKILPATTAISKASSILLNGGTVAFPTETFYGIAALYNNSNAITSIINMKRRPSKMSLPLLTDRFSFFHLVAKNIPKQVENIAKHGWPSGFTVVLPAKSDLDPRLIKQNSIAIRITSNPFAKTLSALVKAPIISTSANISGEPPVTDPSQITLPVDLILDGGITPGGKPSTIVKFNQNEITVIREGIFDVNLLTSLNSEFEIPPNSDKTSIPSSKNWVFQPKQGYRFAIDSILLADFALSHTNKTQIQALDLGAGSGVLSFLLIESEKIIEVDSLEIQEEYCKLFKLASNAQGFSDRINLICGDASNSKNLIAGNFYDLVISNPPFFETSKGKSSDFILKDTAMRSKNIESFIKSASRSLKQGGEFFLILPADRFFDLNFSFKENNFSVDLVRFIHPYKNVQSNRVLLKLRKNTRSITHVLSPLIIYDSHQKYSLEVVTLLNKNKKLYSL